MKKLMLSTITALSFLLPNKLNSFDTVKGEPETKIFINLATGDTVRVRELPASYWNWLDPQLSERLDSLVNKVEEAKEKADTIYRPNLYPEGKGLTEKMEIVYSPAVKEVLEELGYTGEESWGEVGKKLITAWKRGDDYDTSKVIGFKQAIDGSKDCVPYSVVMYTLMKNEGFNPRYVELQKGWFKESGERDSVIIKTSFFFSGHAMVYLNGILYDNSSASPEAEDKKGFRCAEEFDIVSECPPEKSWEQYLEEGWIPAIFFFTEKNQPWDVERVSLDSTHMLHYLFEYGGASAWIVPGLESTKPIEYTIVHPAETTIAHICSVETGEWDTLTLYGEEWTETNRFVIVYSPELKDMVDKIKRAIQKSSSQN